MAVSDPAISGMSHEFTSRQNHALSIAPYATLAATTIVAIGSMSIMGFVTYTGMTLMHNLPIVTQVGKAVVH